MVVIKNYMEDIVFEHLDKVIKNSGGCLCEKCRMDTMAIALNKLPCKYIVTEKGELYTRLYVLQQQFDVDVVSAIVQASLIVKNNPRHTPEEAEDARKFHSLNI